MKKALSVLALAVGLVVVGTAQAYAVVPIVDGATGSFVGEWTNDSGGGTPYAYYLEVFDPNEADIPDAYDISHAILLQELSSVSGDGNFSNDGLYLLIETHAPASLVDLDGAGPLGAAVALSGDFNGDGANEFFATHAAPTSPLDGAVAAQTVSVTNLAGFPGPVIGADLVANGGAFSPIDGVTSVIEYFFPAGAFGTPLSPPGTTFPFNFIGKITYDNSGQPPDDIAVGTLIPEPGTMFLMGTGLLGLLGIRRKQVN